MITGGVYGFEHVNVAQQRRDPDSLMNWMERMIRMRKEAPEIGWGEFSILQTRTPEVLAIRYDWRNNSVVVVHNLSATPREIWLKLDSEGSGCLANLLSGENSNVGCIWRALFTSGALWLSMVPGRRSRLYSETECNISGRASICMSSGAASDRQNDWRKRDWHRAHRSERTPRRFRGDHPPPWSTDSDGFRAIAKL